MSGVFGRSPIGATRRGVIGFSLAASSMAALAACSDDGGSDEIDVDAQSKGAMDNFAADTQFTATEPFNLSVLWTDWPDLPITDKWEFFKEIEKRTNVTIDVTNIPFSDATEKRSLLISAGDAPTVIPLVYTGEENSFVSSGAILPMSEYVEHMPNFQKYVAEWDLADMIDNLKQADGKYYMLPGLQEVSVPVFTLVIRKDVFESVAGGIPQTWDEMREALVKIKAEYPDSKPLADGFEGASMLNYAAHAFGAQAGWGFGSGMIDDGSGSLVYTAATEGYKQMVEFFRGLVEDGLLDTDSMTAANDGTGGGSVTEKVAANLVFAASGSAGTAIEFATALNETVGEGNYEILQIAPPGGPAGQICEPRNFWNGFMLNAEIADSENFIAILQFLDWLYYNPEARELLRWGVLDQTYTKDASGKITLKPEFRLDAYGINPGAPTDIQKDLGWSNAVFADSTESRALKESYNSPTFVEYIDSVLSSRTPRDPNPPAPLDEMELEQASLQATPLKDTVDTATLQFILGDRDIAEWDAYVGELESAGLQTYVDLINTARQRFEEENS
ncbi:extracellular solute-binding protein [Glycomyces algeriensis]|uniref:Sugar ABC transporter substrate-binding protein n=1 Tax=Glycomyces algeriensis TaxID=256037 RepID=A0A9W6GA38_9ACTN|nr:extracellular solute-binding protein [Glycomyces algeriensis]MDA1364411.1 extracellular solute-binding protein [Glycomyces algeriensis]MDR7350444.1 multiple sugar transport system substrate-binding protein/putative aldouronate transport system substrate-binding protein [Glycomyces algeriensis]GLI43151.1 sugar ABC transporter substrate-binding protein [Glycomyces algeriensis]